MKSLSPFNPQSFDLNMQTLKNQTLTIKINPKGAELISLFNEETQTEYMWSADANFWENPLPFCFLSWGLLFLILMLE